MNTRFVMTLSALVMGLTGMILIFMPQKVSELMRMCDTNAMNSLVFQLLGAIYFGFAMTNWTARGNLIGGIYGRPIAIGNLSHFTVASLALVKISFRSISIVWLPALVYTILAIAFGIIFFTHPVKDDRNG